MENPAKFRHRVGLVLVLHLLWVAPASAVTVTLAGLSSSAGGNPLAIGDTVTIDVRISTSIIPLISTQVEAHGYDSSIADFVSGQTTLTFFNDKILKTGEPDGGFENVAPTRAGLPSGSTDLGESPLSGSFSDFVEIFAAISLDPIIGDGSLDNGISGQPISSGDVHARLVFQLLGAGTATVSFDHGNLGGYGYLDNGDSIWVPFINGFSVDLYEGLIIPIPEPSSAVLLGLGLSTLAVRRRRGLSASGPTGGSGTNASVL